MATGTVPSYARAEKLGAMAAKFEAHGEFHHAAFIYSMVGDQYLVLGNVDKARESYFSAEFSFGRSGDQNGVKKMQDNLERIELKNLARDDEES